MRGRALQRLGMMLAFLAGFTGPSVQPGGAGEPATVEALWMAGEPALLKLSDPGGEPLLWIEDLEGPRAVAVDPGRSTVWAWAGRALHAYGFEGEPLLSVPVGLPAAEDAELAVLPEDGSVWLAVGHDLWSFSSSGQPLRSVRTPERIEALALDPAEGLLWVGMRRFAAAHDAVSGALVRTLPLDGLRDLDAGESGIWVAGKGFLRRYGSDGGLLLDLSAGDLLHVAAAPDGGAWTATGKELTRIGPAGEPLLSLKPFAGRGEIVDLIADPGDGSAWVAIHDDLARVSPAGVVSRPAGLRPPLHVRGLALYADLIPPQLALAAPAPGAFLATRTPSAELTYADEGTGVDLASLDVRAGAVSFTCEAGEEAAVCAPAAPLAEGEHLVSATVRDRAGNLSAPAEVRFTVDVTPPRIELVRPVDGLVTSEPEQVFEGSVSEPASLTLNGSPVVLDGQAFLHGPVPLQEGENAFLLTAVDRAGNTGELALTVTRRTDEPDVLPPDPKDVASPVDPTVASDLAADVEFLYTGSRPIQTGVEPGTIEPRRAAVVRGRVIERGGGPLPGARISILGHPELGSTLSRMDGMFDLVVNGGGLLTLEYEKEGRLPAQRQVEVPWRDWVWAPDVALIPYDPEATVVVSGSPELQVARGSAVEDSDGFRRSTLLIPAGTAAEMVLPDGTVQALPTLTLRATEYTVGPQGPEAMPGPLPPTVAYTYAVELSADEAVAAGARRVSFTRPLIHYVENFLGLPVGGAVPVGYCDREFAAWVPSDNGRIVRVLGIAGGLAELDVTGSGAPADGPALAALGIDEAELRRLALLYAPGQSLWRAPIPHLTPWDCNWPYGPPEDAALPDKPEPERDEPEDETCEQAGSVIDCHNQALGEDVPVTGTPFRLHYGSDRVPGRTASRTLKIPLSGSSIPASLKRIEVEVRVAGQRITEVRPPAPEQDYLFVWDGRDAYGRTLQGRAVAGIELRWVFDGVYRGAGSRFSSVGGVVLENSMTREEYVLSSHATALVGGWSARELGLGGWSLSVHHAYDPGSRTLYYGNGRRLSRRSLQPFRQRVAGNPLAPATPGEGIPATSARVQNAFSVAAAPDGGFYFVERELHRVRHVDAQGIVRTVAGRWKEAGFAGDGGPATSALLSYPLDVALGSDGSLYIADTGNHCIRRVDPDGTIRTVAGRGTLSAEGVPASQASLLEPSRVRIAPDGSLYVVESDRSRVRKIGPDGLIWTVAGNGTPGFSGDGGPATQARLQPPRALVLDSAGNLYIGDLFNFRIRRVGLDGIITTVAGGGSAPQFLEGIAGRDLGIVAASALAALPDGSLLFLDFYHRMLLRLNLDGTVTSVEKDRSPLDHGAGLALGPGGTVLFTQGFEIFKLAPFLPGAGAEGIAVPSNDGGELFYFDGRGRHLKTVDALTGALRHHFTYDASGLLSGIADGSGNLTRIERRAGGAPAAVVGPFGDRTELGLNGNGYLARIANPAGEAYGFLTSDEGLLLSQTDPAGRVTRFSYGPDGRLIRDEDAAGGFKALARQASAEGYAVEVSTALGRRTSYAVDRPTDNEELRTNTLPSGEAFRTFASSNATAALLPDGTALETVEAADPRFLNLVPFAAAEKIRTPSGLTSTRTRTREARLSDSANPASLAWMRETLVDNGRTSTLFYDGHERRMTSTSPAGRQRSWALDVLGRVSSVSAAGLEPVAFAYDALGRLSSVSQGTGEEQRFFALSYGADGRLAAVTDPLSRTVSFEYDEAGRVRTQVLPDGRAVGLAYDEVGNVAAVAPPGRPAHGFAYTPVDLLEEYAPPALGSGEVQTRYEHDLDRKLRQIVRADGKIVDLDYDTGGRLSGLGFFRGRIGFERDSAGRLAGITAPGGEDLAFTYDGFLPLRTTWTGPVAGTVERSYDSSLRVKGLTVGGTSAVTFAYDADNLLVRAGALTLTRNAANGLLTGTTLGRVTTAQSYNGFGEPASFATRLDGAPLLSTTYQRDRLGRIVRKEETLGGATDVYLYSYDLAGRLITVERNGFMLSRYDYDESGNRLARTTSAGTETAEYDAQDRLMRYGDTAYSHTANGELVSKARNGQTVVYDYDELGNLRAVDLADGIRIEYLIDGNNRRVGKKVNGVQVQGFLYKDQLEPVAELNGSGQVVSVFVYGSRPHVPDYMVKAGRTYRIVSDHLGSPRLVIDTGTGEVVQQLDYDEFGRVTLDTNPRFQPFGFAGGLYDSHTGLVRFGARDYDPEVGRWTVKDPIGLSGGLNLYDYVHDDPVNFVDTLGEDEIMAFGVESTIAYLGQATMATFDFLKFYMKLRLANTIGADQYFHCMANCRAAQRGAAGESVAELLGVGREIYDDQMKDDAVVACLHDLLANKTGRIAGRPGGAPCKEACGVFRPSYMNPRY